MEQMVLWEQAEATANQDQTPVRCSGARRTTDTAPPPPIPAVNNGRICLVVAEGDGKAHTVFKIRWSLGYNGWDHGMLLPPKSGLSHQIK
jgi:hypothetical protein